jgi:DNA topoisomerase-2
MNATKTIKSIEQQFRKLSEVEHVLLRPGRYIGGIKPHTALEYVPNVKSATNVQMQRVELTYNPGFLKLFDEVLSNSADHSKRPEGKHLDTIRVEVDQASGEITVYDNGGIPVVKHKEYDQWIPEMIFELRAGTNFDDSDESVLTGQNGEGAALTCIFSQKFRVETCDGKNRFLMTFTDNSQGGRNAKVTPADGKEGYTRITYLPDFEKLGMEGIDGDNMNMLLSRVYEVAATNTHLKVYFNGTRVMTRTFKDYIEMFTGADGEYVYDEGESFKVGVSKSEDGFFHTSFVNTSRTKTGGTHISYVVNQIVDGVRAYIEKKHKVVVKPADVRNHMHLFIDATIVNPRYSSQTKDELITEPSAYGRTWTVPEKFIQKLIKTEIVKAILDWVAAKEQAALMAEVRKANKDVGKANYKRVDKFCDALEKTQRHKCVLFLAEGDSAAKALFAARGKTPYIGTFPLRGKVLNVREKDIARVLGLDKRKEKEKEGKKAEPNEIQKILTLIGLQIGVPVRSLLDLNFGKVAFATDADVDGSHIAGLLMNLFDTFWPELFKLGFVHILRTPTVKVTLKDKSVLEFFTEREFHDWSESVGCRTKGWSHRYFKGLGTTKTPDFIPYMENLDQYLFQITMDDDEDRSAVDLAFNGERADDRKGWLETPAANFEDYIVEAA